MPAAIPSGDIGQAGAEAARVAFIMWERSPRRLSAINAGAPCSGQRVTEEPAASSYGIRPSRMRFIAIPRCPSHPGARRVGHAGAGRDG